MPMRADGIDVFGLRIVLGGILLGREKDLLVVLHHILERTHGFLAPDEQRHDHVREHDDVTQRQYGVERRAIDFVHKDLNDCTLGSSAGTAASGRTLAHREERGVA